MRKRAGATEDRLDIRIAEVSATSRTTWARRPRWRRTASSATCRSALADAPEFCGEGFRLVRREWPTDIGPVDLMCRDARGRLDRGGDQARRHDRRRRAAHALPRAHPPRPGDGRCAAASSRPRRSSRRRGRWPRPAASPASRSTSRSCAASASPTSRSSPPRAARAAAARRAGPPEAASTSPSRGGSAARSARSSPRRVGSAAARVGRTALRAPLAPPPSGTPPTRRRKHLRAQVRLAPARVAQLVAHAAAGRAPGRPRGRRSRQLPSSFSRTTPSSTSQLSSSVGWKCSGRRPPSSSHDVTHRVSPSRANSNATPWRADPRYVPCH